MGPIGFTADDIFDHIDVRAFYSEDNKIVVKTNMITFECEIMIRNGHLFTKTRSY